MKKDKNATKHFRDEIRRALIFYTLIPIFIVILAFFSFFLIYVHSSVMKVNQSSNARVSAELEDIVEVYGDEIIRVSSQYPAEQLKTDELLRRRLETEAAVFIAAERNQADFYLLDEDYQILVSTADTTPGFLPPAAGINWGIIRKMESTPEEINFEFISESTKRENQKMLTVGLQKISPQGENFYFLYAIPREYLVEHTVNQTVQVVVTNIYNDVCISNTSLFTAAFGLLKPEAAESKHFLALNEDWYYVNRNKILDSRVTVYTFTPIKNALSLFILDLGMFLIVVTLIAYISVLGASRVARSKTAVIDEIIEAFEHVKKGSLDTPMIFLTIATLYKCIRYR